MCKRLKWGHWTKKFALLLVITQLKNSLEVWRAWSGHFPRNHKGAGCCWNYTSITTKAGPNVFPSHPTLSARRCRRLPILFHRWWSWLVCCWWRERARALALQGQRAAINHTSTHTRAQPPPLFVRVPRKMALLTHVRIQSVCTGWNYRFIKVTCAYVFSPHFAHHLDIY